MRDLRVVPRGTFRSASDYRDMDAKDAWTKPSDSGSEKLILARSFVPRGTFPRSKLFDYR